MSIYQSIQENAKQFAVLIDPDNYSRNDVIKLADMANKTKVSMFFVGGSLLTQNKFEETIRTLKDHTYIPVIIFPGDTNQMSSYADGILLLSMISGRNAELLIGKHVTAAPFLKQSGLEILPTGYMLIDSGRPTTASYISQTMPIPSDKPEIAVSTAMAGEMLGLKLIYLDGGSGAQNAVTEQMISEVKHNISVPLIVGGGIKSTEDASRMFNAGADIVVVGNAIEEKHSLLEEIAEIIYSI